MNGPFALNEIEIVTVILGMNLCTCMYFCKNISDDAQEMQHRHSGSVVERPLCDREVAGSIPGRVIPKTLKMVLAALSLGAQH